jgi:hypothetical protein
VSSTPLIVDIPDSLYAALLDRAAQSKRTLQEELVHVMKLVVPTEPTLPEELQKELQELSTLGDDDLWKAAKTGVSKAVNDRLEDLSFKRGGEGLTEAERKEQQRLLDECDRVMLVRAEAAVLLKRRGFDIQASVQSNDPPPRPTQAP